MATFILIHGAWMGGWVWKNIAPLLSKKHKVITPDLPGLGEDQTPIEKIRFESYLDSLIRIINQQNEKVILVGHSMSGMLISALAEIIPSKIHMLIYLCAFLPRNGESLYSIINNDSLNNLYQFSSDYSSCIPKYEVIDHLLFNCCLKKDIKYAKSLLRPQATKIFHKKIKLTHENFGMVKKVYIKCKKDNIVTIDIQNKMLDYYITSEIYQLDTDHCPFFSKTKELAQILLSI